MIRLGDGNLRTVEQVTTEDLIKSAEATPGVRLDSAKIVRMEAASQTHAVLITFSVASSKQDVSGSRRSAWDTLVTAADFSLQQREHR